MGAPSIRELAPGDPLQLERIGYFVADEKDHRREHPVLTRTVPLRDSWARLVRRGKTG